MQEKSTIRRRTKISPYADSQGELFPLHSPLLGESWLVSFPRFNDMLKFNRYSYFIWDPKTNERIHPLRQCGTPRRTFPQSFHRLYLQCETIYVRNITQKCKPRSIFWCSPTIDRECYVKTINNSTALIYTRHNLMYASSQSTNDNNSNKPSPEYM